MKSDISQSNFFGSNDKSHTINSVELSYTLKFYAVNYESFELFTLASASTQIADDELRLNDSKKNI